MSDPKEAPNQNEPQELRKGATGFDVAPAKPAEAANPSPAPVPTPTPETTSTPIPSTEIITHGMTGFDVAPASPVVPQVPVDATPLDPPAVPAEKK